MARVLLTVALAVLLLAAYVQGLDVKPVVRHPAPEFSGTALLPGGKFGKISKSDFAGKWIVLFFYPRDFTFVCSSILPNASPSVGGPISASSS